MGKLTKKNLRNIQCIFEEKTGVDLNSAHRSRPAARKKLLLAAAVLACCLMLASCTYLLFSPLYEDPLSLSGSYENGVVTVQVVNGSEKTLRFQERVKLMRWDTGEEISSNGGKVVFENTVFPAHSTGEMTIDLSQAYPMEELAQSGIAPNGLYLLLTNNGFQFGHDWICSLRLREPEPETTQEAQPHVPLAAERVDGIDESLRFYFEDHYLDEVTAWNPANGEYMEAVQALLLRQKGTLAHSRDPLLVLDDPKPGVVFDDALPGDAQYQLVLQNHLTLDSFHRMVGPMFPGNGLDCALMVRVPIPQYQGQIDGGIGDFTLLYYFTFLTQEVKQPDAYAFLYGRILTFPEMEANKVYQDEAYTVYDMTDLFYTDLDAYLDDFRDAYGGDICLDGQVRQRMRNIYDYYRDRDNLSFHYVADPQSGLHGTPFVQVPETE